MKRRLSYIWLFVLVVFGYANLSAQTITIGSIHTEPASEMRKLLPLATYLSRELRAEGFTERRVVVAQDLTEMAALIRERKVDLVIDNYVMALALNRLAGSQLVLRRWKKGVAEYHGLIFTRKDSTIGTLEDLSGKTISFEYPFSAVGYLLPSMLLAEKGLKPVPASRPLGANGVGYVFANDDENTMQWVLSGKVAAGAMDNQRYLREARARISELKILEPTPSIPRHVVSAQADLKPSLLNKIKEILMRMERTEDGKKVLQEFEDTAKFDELTEHNVALGHKLKKVIEAELKVK
jgi:phosphonate transport system substrate-binding protein